MNFPTGISLRAISGAALALVCMIQQARADDWPSKQVITLIMPSAPGGSSDPLGRLLAEELGKRIGQSMVVVNRPGAGGNLGMQQASRSKADGYTIVMSWTGPLATNLALYKNVGYDPQNDFAPIGRIGCTPNVLAVSKAMPANSLKEFIDYASRNPGKVSYGTTGVGSSWHIAGEMLNRQASNSITHIPYNSPGAATTDMVGGRIQAMFPVIPMTVPHVRAGDMKVLAVFSQRRSAVLADIPTTVEQGSPDLISDTCFVLLAPKGVPDSAIYALNRSLNAALADEPIKRKIEAMGIDVQSGPPRAVSEYLSTEIPRQAALVKASGATPQ